MPSTSHNHDPQLILVTGLSGAGKATVAKALEDAGFFCIENLPAFMLNTFLAQASQRTEQNRFALVMDTRDPEFLGDQQQVITTIKASPFRLSIIFLSADDSVLLRRYSEMRRRHPSATTVREGIALEKKQLAVIKSQADHHIDTSDLTPHELRALVLKRCLPQKAGTLQINLISFGFKHGPPTEADTIFDVRFLPNPYFVPELKVHTGLEDCVASYVLKSTTTDDFLHKLIPLLQFLIPQYKHEGKVYLTIAIGCTGGKHRSVAIAEKLKEILQTSGEKVTITHRDLLTQ